MHSQTPSQSVIDPTVARSLGHVLLTEQSIYGLILVSGMILVAGANDDASLSVLSTVVITVLVFWLAHVYAGTIATYSGKKDGGSVSKAIQLSVRRTRGLLVSAVFPIAVLALGTLDWIDDYQAVWGALWVNTIVLAILGWVGVARWSSSFWWRLLSALTTALFGAAVIILKALTH